MINDMKAELERILFHARHILEIQHAVNEESRSASKIEQSALKLLGKRDRKICPECGYLFQGNGWDGIDAHWRAKHEALMPYSEAWPLIRAGLYPRSALERPQDLFRET
jgi:hypothetical protein